MRIVMTLLARDEADIVDAMLAFHLNAGVDFVIATDHLSSDGTTEILEQYARDGVLRLLRETGPDMRQIEWVTRMARLAATEHSADWVLNSDADEFWWPRCGDLKTVLEAVPPRFGIVRCLWRNFVPRPEDNVFFAERMTARLALRSPLNQPRNPFHVQQKVIHRASSTVRVGVGNHDVEADGLVLLRHWYPVEVLHYPLRSADQFARKFTAASESRGGDESDPLAAHQDAAHSAIRAGEGARFYESFLVDDRALVTAIDEGMVSIDMRLRDRLRMLRLPGGERDGLRQFSLTRPDALAVRLSSSRPDAAWIDDVGALAERDGIERSRDLVRRLEGRVDELERTLPVLVRSRLRSHGIS